MSLKNQFNFLLKFPITLESLKFKKMAKNDLLKDAIADAKTVRNTALANAKAALEEAFTPKLKSMISAKLTEELEEEKDEIEEMGYDEPVDEDMYEGDYMDEDYMEEDMYEAKDKEVEEAKEEDSMDEEISLEEILAELELEEAKDDSEEEEKMEGKKPSEKEMDEEIDLNELMLEIEANEDIDLNELLYELEEEESQKEPQNEVIGTGIALTGALVLGMLGAGILGSSANQQIETVAKEAYKKVTGKNLPDASIEKLKSGGQLPGMDKEQLKQVHSAIEDKVKSLPWYKKMFASKKIDTGQFSQKPTGINAEGLEKMETELNEAYRVIRFQKEKLNEVNVLNSKLLYVNKLFKAHNLNEDQKVKVVDSLDQAESAKEAKLIYNTLNEAFSSVRSQIKESVKAKSFASKATGVLKENKISKAPQEDETTLRWKKLANIN